jgi:putative ABC transport system substrate-binding protein
MSRAIMVALVALGMATAPAEVQQPARIPRVGFLHPGNPSSASVGAFHRALADLGYVEGKNVVVESRFVEGQYERVPEAAAELLRLGVDVIAIQGAVTVRAAKKTVTSVPMVFVMVVDPVAEEVVSNVQRPGGNITGVTTFDPDQARKQLELLRQVLPRLHRVALIGEQGVREDQMRRAEQHAHAMGIQTQRVRITPPNPDLEGAFVSFSKERADAVLVMEEPLVVVNRKRIAELAAKYRLPTVFTPSMVDAGGLIGYGTTIVPDGYRRMVEYVDKVLKGAKPGELPVETVVRYALIVNLKTAQEIGVAIPPEVVKGAERVIR